MYVAACVDASATTPQQRCTRQNPPRHHTMRATRSSWKCLPPPEATAPLGFDAVFTDAEAEQLMLGVVPERMEDKWFI